MPALARPLKVKPLKSGMPPAYQFVTARTKSRAGLVQAPRIRDGFTVEKLSEKIRTRATGRDDEGPVFPLQRLLVQIRLQK